MPAATETEIKAKIIGDLLAGDSGCVVAERYGVHDSTVSRIKSSLSVGELQILATEKSNRVKDALYDYLLESIQTLREQLKVARNEKYLQEQPASDFAVLHGVISDKALRLLDANQRAAETRIRELELANDARSLGEFTDTNQTGAGEDPDFNRLSDNPDREEFSRVPA